MRCSSQFADAQRTVEKTTDTTIKTNVLHGIVTTEAEAGRIAEAERTALQFTEQHDKSWALASIVEV